MRRQSAKQSPRLLPLYQSLITQLTGATAEEDAETFKTGVEYLAKTLDPTVKPAGNSDMGSADSSIRGCGPIIFCHIMVINRGLDLSPLGLLRKQE